MENKTQLDSQLQEIDLLDLAKKVWNNRKLILKVCGIAAVLGLVIAFSIPKEYTSTILIAPESTSSKSGGSLSSLASLAGINMGSGSSRDAIYPDLYPDIVSSTPFLVDLFEIPIALKAQKTPITLAEYMKNYQKAPWWSCIVGFPFRVISWVKDLFKKDNSVISENKGIDVFQLSSDEMNIAKSISGRINISVEKKTWVTTLNVTMQDALAAATIADTVRSHLQKYVTEYRTSKARNTLVSTEKLFKEAKDEYQKAQEEYAVYSDRNRDLFTLSSRAELERLQNERNLAYNMYNQMAQQLQLAKANVDEFKPVFTIIQPASVPLTPSKPSKAMILIAFVFLGGLGSVAWILFLRDALAKVRKHN